MTGLSVLSDGIGIARIHQGGANARPQLSLCSFHPTTSGADQATKLAELSSKYALEATDCSSLMDASQSSLLLVEAPEVDPTELKAAVRWRIKDLIDFHIDDAVIDVFDIEGQRERGRAKMMYVVVARISTVQEHIDALEGAGINLSVIDIAELAQRNIAALLPEDAAGVALLHFSHNAGLLTITRQGNLFLARTLDFGSERLATEAMENAFSISDIDAVAGAAETGDALPAGLQRLLDNIVLEVQRSLDYYESHFALPPVSALVLAPTEQPVPGLLSYLGSNLGVPVRMLDLSMILESAVELPDELQAQCLPAIGAALRVEERAL